MRPSLMKRPGCLTFRPSSLFLPAISLFLYLLWLQEVGNGPEYSSLEVDQGNGWS